MEGHSAGRHRGERGPVHGVDDLLDLRRAEARHRRVAAHAAGVGSLVAVEDPLVVLRRGQRHDVLAVAEGQQRELFALEELLQHDGRRAEAPLAEEDLDRLARGGLGVADDHALAGRQAVGLEDRGIGGAGELLERLLAARSGRT